MEEGCAGIFVVIAMIIVTVVFLIVTACAIAAGLVAGGCWAFVSYWQVLGKTVKPEPLPVPPFDPAAAPAIRGYFFGKGYRDLRQQWLSSFEANRNRATEAWDEAEPHLALDIKKAEATYQAAFAAGVTLFGAIFTLLLSAVHAAALLVLTVLVYAAFVVLRVLEQLYRLVRGYIFVCPRCHHRLGLPIYVCAKCDAHHPALIPSEYGVLRHRCRCGAKLPATMLLGRGALNSQCPNDGFVLSRAHTEAPKTCIPIVGATSVGKTAFALALCREVVEAAPRLGMDSDFLSPETGRIYAAGTAAMQRGRAPDKSIDRVPHAIDLLLERAGKPQRVLYLYDPAGEAFTDRSYLAQHRFLSYPDGIILMLDPFAFPPLAQKSGANLLSEVRASHQTPDDVTIGLLNVLETEFSLGAKQHSKVPLAVVVNKIDAAGLEAMIGAEAIERGTAAGEKPGDARNRVIREHLLRWEQTPLVDQLETRFRRIGYFAVSALGRSEDQSMTPFKPRGVLEPLTWLLEQSGGNWLKGV